MVGRLTLVLCAQHSVASMIEAWSLATGNIGGGEPQPEYLGGGWQDEYGEFEEYLGGTILALVKGDPNNWKPKDKEYWTRYYNKAKTLFSANTIPFKTATAKTIFEIEAMPDEIIKTLPLPPYNKNFDNLHGITIENFLRNEFVKGMELVSGAENDMKGRKVFPYLTEEFQDLVKSEPEQLVERYLEQIGDTNLKKDTKKLKPNENPWKDHAENWPYVMLYDLLVVQMFRDFFKNKYPAPIKIMDFFVMRCKIKEIMEHARDTNDIFFVQEIKDCNLCAHECAACTQGDTAILFNKDVDFAEIEGATGDATNKFIEHLKNLKHDLSSKNRETAEQNQYYKYLNKDDFYKDFHTKDPTNGKYKLQNKYEKFTTTTEQKFTFSVGEIKGKYGGKKMRVMLMSGHPDSDGIFCRLYLAVARDVFNSIKKDYTLTKLIVGMDTNILPDDHIKQKSKKVFKELGYEILAPTDATVNKQRTFFQSQISKAAKLDNIVKDMLLYYPEEKTEMTADVYNKFTKHCVPTYSEKKKYPTNYWPIDHFIVYADNSKGNGRSKRKCFKENPGSTCQGSRTTAQSVKKLAQVVRRVVHFVKQASTGVKNMPPSH